MPEWKSLLGTTAEAEILSEVYFLCNVTLCPPATKESTSSWPPKDPMLANGISQDNWPTQFPSIASEVPGLSVISLSFSTWLGLITVLLLIFTALGNTLVCIAIAWDKRLQNMTNYFLMSLAVTDFMVALLVMPFGILVVVKGTFPLAPIYCIVWITLDVLFCTCSILHLCTLSVDRYLSLRYPIKYGRNKTKRRVVLKICLVWMTSVAMSVPLCLMYSRDDQEVIKDGICAIQDPLFMTIGSIISFYIPLIIMLITHALTLRLLKEAEKNKTFAFIGSEYSVSERGGSGSLGSAVPPGTPQALRASSTNANSPFPCRHQQSYTWKRLLSKTNSNVSTSTDADGSDAHSVMELQRLTTPHDTPALQIRSHQRRSKTIETHSMDIGHSPKQNHTVTRRKISKDDDDDDSSSEEVWVEVTIDPSTGRASSVALRPDSGRHSDPSPVVPLHGTRCVLCCSANATADVLSDVAATFNGNGHGGRGAKDSHAIANRCSNTAPISPPRISQGSDESGSATTRLCEITIPMRTSLTRSASVKTTRPTTRHGRFIQSERKATKVLGIVFFTFVVLWAPFFCLNIVSGLCPSCAQSVSPTLAYFVLWLGYASSTVNPVFYTIFNPTFRQTFVRILTLQCKQ